MKALDTRDLEVNLGGLNKAKSMLKNRNLLLIQKYTINKKLQFSQDSTGATLQPKKKFRMNGTFSHILSMEINKKTYSDILPKSGFYDTTYISKTLTFDSLSARSIKNTIRFDFSTDETRKFRLGGGVGIRNELFKYSQILPTDTVPVSDTAVWIKGNNVLVGRLFNDIGEKFRWVATGELYFSGYRAGDFDLDGNSSSHLILKKEEQILTFLEKLQTFNRRYGTKDGEAITSDGRTTC